MQIIDGIKKFEDKFENDNFVYRKKRRALAEEFGDPEFWTNIDAFGLYAGVQTTARFLAMYELLKLSLAIPGHIAEFGVWKGNNTLFMAKVLELMQPNTYKHIYGFDSFEGLPAPVDQDLQGQDAANAGAYEGMYKGDLGRLQRMIDFFGFEEWIHFVIGDAMETIPRFENENKNVMLSFALVDFDLYEPACTALEFAHRRLMPGGIIAFDEAMSLAWPGEGTAVQEFLSTHSGDYEAGHITFSRMPTMYLRRR